jgi:probable HAF family extracellular repeat protein
MDRTFSVPRVTESMKRGLSKGFIATATLVALAAVLTPGQPAQAQSITGLGHLPGDDYAEAVGVSADGLVVVGTSAGYRAYRWTRAGGMEELAPGSPYSSARAASADGAVVVGLGDLGDGRTNGAFRWTQAGGMVALASIPGRNSSADGVNADGSVVCGNSESSQGPRALRWTSAGVDGGTMQDLGTLSTACGLGETIAEGWSISADGSVVAGDSSADGESCTRHWFRWVSDGNGGGTMSDLNVVSNYPAAFARALAISGDGAVVVGIAPSANNIDSAFRWTSTAGMQHIGPPTANPNYISEARAASADGSAIVGYFLEGPIGEHAMLWTSAQGPLDLNTYLASLGVDMGDWWLTFANGISADGLTIVGNGYHTISGQSEAWIADLHRTCGSADFDCDGDIGTDADIESFFACLAGTCPAAPCTGSADFNGDGDIGTDADIEGFFRVLAGGAC